VSAASPLIDIRLLDHPVEAVAFEPFPQPAGAECVFLGRTRTETHATHGELTLLRYEAYPAMAERLLRDLAERAIREHELLAVRLHHAIGDVPPGAASVLVQVVSGHRDASFRACRQLIDDLKRSVPIWKQECWADGTTWSDGAPVPEEDTKP
jgi:molybdopterin synthase catalytic subunit